jgi:hypothetical protein
MFFPQLRILSFISGTSIWRAVIRESKGRRHDNKLQGLDTPALEAALERYDQILIVPKTGELRLAN